MLAGRLLPCSALLPTTISTPYLNKTCNPIERNWTTLHVKSQKSRFCAVYSHEVAHNSQYDTWEEPDDGSNSDYESEVDGQEEEGEEEWESEQEASFDDGSSLVASTISPIEDDFVREVEQLLTAEEREILKQNEAPVLNKISTTKWGILQTLALSQQIPFMDKLLLQGLPIDAPDKDGSTALHKAVIGKREAVISHLLRKGANPHVRDKDGATPLHYAVQVGAIQTLKLLIKYKVDVNAEDNEGWTPLHIAIQSRSRDIAKILLVNGADKTRRTKSGTSVLDLCLCYGKDFKSYDLTKLVKLVPAGVDP